MRQPLKTRLLRAARKAEKHSYSPYSHFPVGAAVLTDKGRVYAGTNVENSSFGLTVCAERVALFTAVAAGARQIAAVLVYTDTDTFTPPCGACLQVLAEFGANPEVILACRKGLKHHRLVDLLPAGFRLG
ncbi:MAG: cytidine deaminase [candidate division WOR-3 bacterium]